MDALKSDSCCDRIPASSAACCSAFFLGCSFAILRFCSSLASSSVYLKRVLTILIPAVIILSGSVFMSTSPYIRLYFHNGCCYDARCWMLLSDMKMTLPVTGSPKGEFLLTRYFSLRSVILPPSREHSIFSFLFYIISSF